MPPGEEEAIAIPDGVGESFGRRQFLGRFLAAGGVGLGAALLHGAGLGTGPSRAQAATAPPKAPPPGFPPNKQNPSGITVRPDDPAITAGMIEYPGVITPLLGYLSAPTGSAVYPGILVLHEVEGLTEHYKDITRRLARSGYVALAPDLLSRAGGTAKLGDLAHITAALGSTGTGQFVQDMNTSVRYLESQPLVSKSRIGVLAFGIGATLMWILLTQNHDIKAAVGFSANPPSPTTAPNISAAVLVIFGDGENRDKDGIAQFEAAMQDAGLGWSAKIEPKAGPGFFNDVRDQYVPDAAQDAWRLTLDWYAKYLAG